MRHLTPLPPAQAPVAQTTIPACPEPVAEKALPKQEEFNYEIYNSLTPSKNKIRNDELSAPNIPVVRQKPASSPSPISSQVWFTEELVLQMETSWADLPSQISMSREQTGWRVHSFPQGSLFAEAGLQPGDLIPDRAIEAMKYSEQDEDHLAERVTAIFNHAIHR